jgi:DNA-binding GntR family transcriptional regulator
LNASLQTEIRLALAQLRPAYPDASVLAAEHRALLQAIIARDAERAPALMREHLDRAVADLTGEAVASRARAASG